MATGTSNSEKPFEPGERIEFCDEEYVVVSNYGSSGSVRDMSGTTIGSFHWTFQGAVCRRVTSELAQS